MTTEKEELEIDLRAVYGEQHPYRDPVAMRISDDVLALGILMRREIELLRRDLKDARTRLHRLETRNQSE